MKVFDFENYKEFVLARVQSMKNQGRGEFGRIAEYLKMHTTRVSHVFRGSEQLTLEQACTLARYFGMIELETEYFVALVQLERAGTQDLKRLIKKQLAELRKKSQELVNRLPTDRVFTESEKALFYSNLYFSGIRLLTSIPEFQNIDAIADRLELPKEVVGKVLEFLLQTGLCVEKEGKLSMGPTRTHLEAHSPLVSRLHTNWRLKAIEKYPKLRGDELAFTAPMSILREDFPLIRETLVQTIEKVAKIANKDEAQQVACLNIDWFEY